MTEDEIRRYARQLVLPQHGGAGQARLAEALVSVVGAGGLGAPLLLYLAGAGVGRIRVIDDDRVELGNLHRQVLYAMADLGRAKAEAAASRITALNPLVTVEPIVERLDAGNADRLLQGSTVVADGSDGFATRIAVADACHRGSIPLVAASVQGTDGQLAVWKPFAGPPEPCMRCLYERSPDERALPTCAAGGVLGPAAGLLACMQATEILRLAAGFAEPSPSGLLHVDALAPRIDRIGVKRRPDCDRICTCLPRATR